MHEAYVNICDIPTKIMTWGKWIEDSLDDVKEIAICITGNPGLPGFYTEFLGLLHSELNCEIPVWVIGHLGHDEPPASNFPPLHGNEALYNLDGQVRHKINFIEQFVPEHVRLHLMGHSIGAWMVLRILKQESSRKRVHKCYLLFPTIERMRESPNGIGLTHILRMYSLMIKLITLFHRLPFIVKIYYFRSIYWFLSHPYYFMGSSLKLWRPSVIEKVVFLAKEELEKVCHLEKDFLKKNVKVLKLFYGAHDKWVPVQYYEELKRNIPNIDATLDTKGIPHQFVLGHSVEMAKMMGRWIQENKLQQE